MLHFRDQNQLPKDSANCPLMHRAVTLLSLLHVALQGPEPTPEGLGQLPLDAPGTATGLHCLGKDRLGTSDLSAHHDCTTTPPSHSAGTASSPHWYDAVITAVQPCGLHCFDKGLHSPQSPLCRTSGTRTNSRRTRPTAP